MEKSKDPTEIQNQKQNLEIQILEETLQKQQNIIEGFLEDWVPLPIIENIAEILKDLFARASQIQKKGIYKTSQEHTELKNTEWLYKKVSQSKKIKYWQLLQLLYKFPSDLQIGLDENICQYLEKSLFYKTLGELIPIQKYIENAWSLKRFLTDCIAFARLKRIQLKYISELAPGQTPHEKVKLLEAEFSLVPDNFLLERRLGGHGGVGIFKGMDIAKNVPVVIKYLTQQQEGKGDSSFRTMGYQESKKRFEREAKAFEKLERHRKAKEQAVTMLTEQAQKQIEEGKKTGNSEKLKAGFALLKQGQELDCDRYFVKAYCLATGQLNHFSSDQEGFQRCQFENVGFMVMEYVEGINLETLIQEYKDKNTFMPMKVFIPIMEGILRALDYCHTEGIIHRDVRPDNILITRNFKVRLTNLGRAKVEDMTQLTAQGVFVGTPGYAAPEGILHGKEYSRDFSELVTATDHRFDLYSLGCVAYEMLTGNPPFVSNKKSLEEKDLEILNKHLTEQPVSMLEIRKDIPEAINLLVMRLLAKKPENRFPSAREVLTTLRSALSLGQKAEEYTQKFLEKLKPVQQESIFPQRKPSFVRRMAWACMILVILSMPFLYAYRQEIFPKAEQWARNAWQTVRYETISFFRQDRKESKEADSILQKLAVYHKRLQEKWEANESLRDNLNKNFSPEQGYPEVGETIESLLVRSKKDLDRLENAIIEGKELLISKGGKETLSFLKNYTASLKEEQEEGLLDRIYKKLKSSYDLAFRIKKARDEEENTRKNARVLRNYLFSAQERVALVEEKLSILKENYPSELRYPGIDAETMKSFRERQKATNDLNLTIDSLNKIFLQGDIAQAQKKMEEYRSFGKVLDDLVDMDESITQILDACKKMKQQRENKQTIDKAFLVLDERTRGLQEKISLSRKLWEDNISLLPEDKEPKELLEKAQNDLKNLKDIQKNITQYLDSNKEKDAIEVALSYSPKEAPTSILELQQYIENRQVKINIAKAAQVAQKKKSETEYWQKQITPLLYETKISLSNLNKASEKWEQELHLLEQNFPDEYKQFSDKDRVNTQIEKRQSFLQRNIDTVQNLISEQNFEKAYQTLTQIQKNVSSIPQYIDSLSSEEEKIANLRKSAINKKETQVSQMRASRIVQKLQRYVSIMQEQLEPVQREIQALYAEFPPEKKYPVLSERSQKTVQDAEKSLLFYQKEIQKAQEHLKSNRISDALSLLGTYEEQRLVGYTEFSNNFKELQEDIVRTRSNALQRKADIQKIEEVEEYLTEIQTRKTEIDACVSSLNQKIAMLRQYSTQQGYQREDPNIAKYIEDASQESKQLGIIVDKSNQLLEEKKYAKAISLLQPYSNKINPGMTLLPLLKTYIAQCDKALQVNSRMENDPQLRQKLLFQEQEAKKKQEQLKAWQKSPGPWFDRVMPSAENYMKMDKEILSSIQNKGSMLVHARIQSTIIKLRESLEYMAELREIEEEIRKKGGTLPSVPEDKDKWLVEYLRRNRTILVDVDSEISEIEAMVKKISGDIRSGWVEESTLRDCLRSFQALERKFEEKLESIKSRLLTIATNF